MFIESFEDSKGTRDICRRHIRFERSDWEELLERSSPQTPLKNFQKGVI